MMTPDGTLVPKVMIVSTSLVNVPAASNKKIHGTVRELRFSLANVGRGRSDGVATVHEQVRDEHVIWVSCQRVRELKESCCKDYHGDLEHRIVLDECKRPEPLAPEEVQSAECAAEQAAHDAE
jgi:hypothetical protein